MRSKERTILGMRVGGISASMIAAGMFLGSTPAIGDPVPSIPPPPAIPGAPRVIYSSYPTVFIGDSPTAGSSQTKTASEVYYRYSPQSAGLLAYVNQRVDCGSTGADARIIKGPMKGRLQIDRAPPPPDVRSNFWDSPNDPRRHCDASKGQALWVRYVPVPGATGADSAVVEISDGLKTYRVAVWIEIPPQ